MTETLDFPLPPTTTAYLPPTSIVAPPAPVSVPDPTPPEADEVVALRAKVAELDRVVELARIRVETLGAEKREALERALRLEAELEAAGQREAELLARLDVPAPPRSFDEPSIADLANRVAALEALIATSRAA